MKIRAILLTVLLLGASMIHASELHVAKGWTGKVIARGARVHGANGIAFDAADRLYIASLFGRNITVMDPDTGKILQRLGPDVGVEGPDDVAIGPDGSICWTVLFQGEVGCLSQQGVKSTAAVLPGAFNPITFSSSGRLFVGQTCCETGGLYEVDPQGIKEPRLIANDLSFINGMDFGPDGFLYAPVTDQGKVIRIKVNSGAVKTIAEGFNTPVAVKFDSHGRLYLVDYATGEVVRIDVQTGAKEIIATIQPGLDNLAIDSHDRLFVSGGEHGGFIVEVQSDGTKRTVSRGGMFGPSGVAVQSRNGVETVFVADTLGGLRQFDGITGHHGHVDGVFLLSDPAPGTVSIDGDNLLLTQGDGVLFWNPQKRREAAQRYELDEPTNAIRFRGDLVIGDSHTGSVILVPANNLNRRIVIADKLERPSGFAATDNDLWVADSGAGIVWQIVAEGKRLKKPVQVASGLSAPEGLAVRKGHLLVVEGGAGRLLEINLSSYKVRTIASGLELGTNGASNQPAFHFFSGVAVGPSGAVYVTGDQTNVLYKFERTKKSL